MSTTHTANAWMRVAVFDKLAPAQTFLAFLQRRCFDARIHDERSLQRFWFFSKPKAGVIVEVPEESFAWVKDFLESQPAKDVLLRNAIRCPSCGSLRVEYPQMTRKNVLPALLAQLFVAAGVMDHECYCEECHNTWSLKSKSTRPWLKRQTMPENRLAESYAPTGMEVPQGK